MLKILENCPECGSVLERVNDQLFCRNKNCAAQSTKAVEKYAKVLKIKGLGIKTIEKLNISSIEDIYRIPFSKPELKIGDKLADKLIYEVEKAKKVELSTFLSAQSIPLIGNTAAQKIICDDIADIDFDLCKKCGLGDKAATNLSNWIANTYPLLNLPIVIVYPDRQEVIQNGKTICITGRHEGHNRETLTLLAKAKGYKVTKSLSSNTDYLLVPSKTHSSTKTSKAIEMGIELKTINEI